MYRSIQMMLTVLLSSLSIFALPQIATVRPVVETEAVLGSRGDHADDPAIWVHPSDSSLSLIIGANKDSSGGLEVYDLQGKRLQFIRSGAMNNVDVRYGFPLGDARVDLACGTNRSKNTVDCFKIDAHERRLQQLGEIRVEWISGIYGMCMYKSRQTDKYHVIANDESGLVQQFELDGSGGRISWRLIKKFNVGGRTEGCVADDELGYIYIGEESKAVWKYSADNEGVEKRKAIDKAGGNLSADIEGMTIYYRPDGTGYLIVSSQGSSTFSVYTREGENRYLGSFRIGSAAGIDNASSTDGIDVSSVDLGSSFPHGLFVAHDNSNEGARTSNFKLIPWQEIAEGLNLGAIQIQQTEDMQ